MIIDDRSFDRAVALAEALQLLSWSHALLHLFKLADRFAVWYHIVHLKLNAVKLVCLYRTEYVRIYRLLATEAVIVAAGSAAGQEVLSSEAVGEEGWRLGVGRRGVPALWLISFLLVWARCL